MDCKRRIKRRWEEKTTQKNVKCTFQLSHAGNIKNVKILKGRKLGSIAQEVLNASTGFRKAPNNLPYEKLFVLEFKEFPELDLQLK